MALGNMRELNLWVIRSTVFFWSAAPDLVHAVDRRGTDYWITARATRKPIETLRRSEGQS
jgi:hypothetical protein